jgi:hypothetical protein
MSLQKLFIQLIQSLEDPEMDKVARQYLTEIEGEYAIFNCNGPYDMGLDMRGFDITNINAQYQITTREKKFEEKLNDDLSKAKRNVVEYSLPARVTYFYSYKLSSQLILEYKKLAKVEYNLILNLVEASNIAGAAVIYNGLKDLILELSEIKKLRSNDDYFNDLKVRAFYDLMSFGVSTDIKNDILKSYVLNHLIAVEKSEVSKILISINTHFSTSIDESYFDGFLHKLKSERKIQINDGCIQLTPPEKERLNNLIEVYRNEETLLKKELTDILKEYKLEHEVDLIIIHLGKLYESNYSSNLGEFTDRKSNIQDLRSATEEFNIFIQAKIGPQKNPEDLVKRLLKVSDENEILSRIAAGRVYSKVSAPEKLQDYIFQNNNNKEIFFDTNVLVYLIFVHYDENANFNTFHFPAAKQLLAFRNKYNLFYLTSKTYAIETANIFKDALSILPFTKLPIFDSLGGSSNIVYRFYLHLKDHDRLEENIKSFEDFLLEFKFLKKGNLEYNYFSEIKYLLDSLDIEIETPPLYDLNSTVDIITKSQKDKERFKSSFAIKNDAIMIKRLGDSDVEINPLDPIFCTWDLSLFGIRKSFFDENPDCTKWMMYTPTRLMDHFSMMNFEVKSGTLSNEVLSILEEDFSFQSRTQSLLDTMINIINPENEVGLKYTNKLGAIRNQHIIQIEKTEESLGTGIENSSVDIVFRDLFKHYAFNPKEGIFDSFKSIFTKEEYFDDVFSILRDEIESTRKVGVTSESLFLKMDDILNSLLKSSI